MENAMVNSGLHKANSELSIIQEVNSAELSIIQEANSELSILQQTNSHENVLMCKNNTSNSNTSSSSSCKTAKVSFKKPLHSVSFHEFFRVAMAFPPKSFGQ